MFLRDQWALARMCALPNAILISRLSSTYYRPSPVRCLCDAQNKPVRYTLPLLPVRVCRSSQSLVSIIFSLIKRLCDKSEIMVRGFHAFAALPTFASRSFTPPCPLIKFQLPLPRVYYFSPNFPWKLLYYSIVMSQVFMHKFQCPRGTCASVRALGFK